MSEDRNFGPQQALLFYFDAENHMRYLTTLDEVERLYGTQLKKVSDDKEERNKLIPHLTTSASIPK